MRVVLYTIIFLLLSLSNNLLGQVDLEGRYYQENQVDFKFRTDNAQWLPEEQIENTIDFLLEDTIESSDQFSIRVSTNTPIDSFGIWVQQHIASYLREHDLESSQLILKAVEAINEEENDLSKEGRYVMVWIEHWKKIEQIEVPTGIVLEDKVEEVSTEVQAVSFDKIEAFFEKKQTTQTFVLRTDIGQVITGEKGTILNIPPNSFVDEEGELVTEKVTLRLKEVYELEDMIIEQVQTTSEGKLIETGGMLFIEVTNAVGDTLQLAENKTISAVMASDEVKLPNMQTFEGVIGERGRIDWKATGAQVLLSSNPRSNRRFTAKLNRPYQASSLPKVLELDYNDIQLLPDLPIKKTKPELLIEKPQYPNLIAGIKYTLEEVRAKFPIHKNESRDHYNKRIGRKMNALRKHYYAQQNTNKVIMSAYRSDMITYRNAKRLYERQESAYARYCGEMKKLFQMMSIQVQNFDLDAYDHDRYILGRAFSGLDNRVDYINQKLNLIITYGEKVGERYAQLDSLSKVAVDERTRIRRVQRLVPNMDGIFNPYLNLFNGTRNKNRLAKLKSWLSLKEKIVLLEQQIDTTRPVLTEIELEQIRKLYTELEGQQEYNNKQEARTYCKKAIERNKNNILFFLEVEGAYQELDLAFERIKQELGLLTTEDIVSRYGSVLEINNLGWINCDRFILDRSPRINCEILVTNPSNTQFYMVFEDISSMMRSTQFERIDTNNSRFTFSNIPSNQKVRLVGIQIESQKISGYFVKEGLVKDFKSIEPIFTKTETEEVLETIVDVAQ
jgi:hypothetical protein